MQIPNNKHVEFYEWQINVIEGKNNFPFIAHRNLASMATSFKNKALHI